MYYFKHVSGTWLLAHALHPLVWGCWGFYQDGLADFSNELIGLGIAVFAVGAALTLLLLIWLLFAVKHSLRSTLDVINRFILWYVIVLMSFIAYSVLASLIILGNIPFLEMLLIFAPASIAILLALSFRMKSFKILCSIHDNDEIEKQSIENIINYNQP